MDFQAADLLDAHEDLFGEDRLRVVAPMFRCYGGRAAFHGVISTLKLFADQSLS